MASFYRLSMVTMSLSAAVWQQFWMQSYCLRPSPMYAELPHRIIALIVTSDISASAQHVWACSHSGKSLSFRDWKLDADTCRRRAP